MRKQLYRQSEFNDRRMSTENMYYCDSEGCWSIVTSGADGCCCVLVLVAV